MEYSQSVSDQAYLINRLYFWLSLTFIITRTLTSLYLAASIHDASKAPLKVFRNVPPNEWSVEVNTAILFKLAYDTHY